MVELRSLCCIMICSDGSINSQDYKSFEMDAVTIIKKSVTEYHHLINRQAYGLF